MANLPEESFDTFRDAMHDVKPLTTPDTISHTSFSQPSIAQQLKRQSAEQISSEDTNYLSIEKVEPIDPYDFLAYKKAGIQDGVYKNLRLGKYDTEYSIHLTQMPFKQARHHFFIEIMNSFNTGIRSLRIHHGMGIHSKPFPAFMKSYVNQWLKQIPEVIAFHTALKHHGGMGATYVLLKKNKNEKLKNKEQLRRR